jgi:hypothetical protein
MKNVSFLGILGILLILCCGLWAQGQSWLWASRYGGAGSNISRSIALDDAKNIYTAGYFDGTYSYGTSFLSSAGMSDICITKTYANGNPHWSKRAGSTGNDCAYSIAVDDARNTYITGSFQETVSFGSTNLTSSGSNDIFVAKMSSTGSWLWAARAGGDGADTGNGISLDSAGNIYVTGYFSEIADFGSSTQTSAGVYDVFVAKLDNDGNWLWSRKLGSTSQDQGKAICARPDGTCYITGSFYGTVSVGTVAVLISAGLNDAFIAGISTGGTWLWARRAGGTAGDCGEAVSYDAANNCYVTGEFRLDAQFGATTLTSAGNEDVFLTKLNSAGTWQWAVRGGGSSNDTGYGISCAGDGYVYASGRFGTTASFGTHTLSSAGSSDAFITGINSNGNWQWAVRVGGVDSDYCYGIMTDNLNSIYLTGFFMGTADFGPFTLTSSGSNDAFVAKLGYQIPLPPQDIQIVTSGNDVVVTWDPVTMSIYGDPLTPDFYVVYKSTDPASGSYSFAGICYGTTYTWINTALQPRYFFKVTAYKDYETSK